MAVARHAQVSLTKRNFARPYRRCNGEAVPTQAARPDPRRSGTGARCSEGIEPATNKGQQRVSARCGLGADGSFRSSGGTATTTYAASKELTPRYIPPAGLVAWRFRAISRLGPKTGGATLVDAVENETSMRFCVHKHYNPGRVVHGIQHSGLRFR